MTPINRPSQLRLMKPTLKEGICFGEYHSQMIGNIPHDYIDCSQWQDHQSMKARSMFFIPFPM